MTKIKILYEKFNVYHKQYGDEKVLISHEKWSTLGIGPTFSCALSNLGESFQDVIDAYSGLKDDEMSTEAQKMNIFASKFLYQNQNDVLIIEVLNE